MADYVNVRKYEDSYDVTFYIDYEKPLSVGSKMGEIADVEMNGYNWEAFFNCYLEKNAPEILEAMDSDPEAGMYAAYFNNTSNDAETLAYRFAEIIEQLVENEEEAFDFLSEFSDEMEWD